MFKRFKLTNHIRPTISNSQIEENVKARKEDIDREREEIDNIRRCMIRVEADSRRSIMPIRASHLKVVRSAQESRKCGINYRGIETIRSLQKQELEQDRVLKEKVKCEVIKDVAKNIPLGLWKRLNEEFHTEDKTVWEIFRDGIPGVGPVRTPSCWSPRKKNKGEREKFDEKFHHFVNSGSHRKPNWGNEMIDTVYNQSTAECELGPALGFKKCEGPYREIENKDWYKSHRRFGRAQKNKIRMINPAMAANDVSKLEKRIPISSPEDILTSAWALKQNQQEIKKKSILDFKLKSIKQGKKASDEFEKFFRSRVGEKGNLEELDSEKEDNPIWEEIDKKFSHSRTAEEEGELERIGDDDMAAPVPKRAKTEEEEITDIESTYETFAIVIDVTSALNLLPINPRDKEYYRFLSYNRKTGKYEGFQARSGIFGSIHPISEWTRLGKMIVSVVQKIWGIPTVDYVDDFTFLLRVKKNKEGEEVREKLKEDLIEFFQILGLPVRYEKIKTGSRVEILGLDFCFEGEEPDVGLTEERIGSLCGKATQIEEEKKISPTEAHNYLGKLIHGLTAISDRKFLPVLKPLKRVVYLDRETVEVGNTLKDCLEDIKKVLSLRTRKKIKTVEEARLGYSDASYKGGRGSVSSIIVKDGKLYGRYYDMVASEIDRQASAYPINFLETVAGAILPREFEKDLRDKFYILSVDNNSALSYLLKKRGRAVYMRPASSFWLQNTRIQASTWIVRVPSYANIADILTRDNKRKVLQRYFPGLFQEVKPYDKIEELREMLAGKGESLQTELTKFTDARIREEYGIELVTEDENDEGLGI